ncbi:MAG: universal stress protein [Cyclobacteriaceae bacterium]
MTPKNILVPIDFSACSINALKLASKLATTWHSKIHAVHAIAIPATYVSVSDPMVPAMSEGYDQKAQEDLQKLLSDMPELTDVRYESHVSFSSLVGSVDEIMAKQPLDMIVMGTKGKHDRLEKLLGGQSAEMIQQSNIPVLVIPENIRVLNISKIGLATDSVSLHHETPLKAIRHFQELSNAAIEVFYVGKDNESVDFGLSELKRSIDSKHFDSNIEFHNVHENKIEHGILEHIHENAIDMLVMMPRDHAFIDRLLHSSVTKKVAMRIDIPLLTIKD